MCILYSVNSILNWMKEIALAFSKMMDSFLAYFTTACTHHADVVSRKTCRTPAKPRICGYNEDEFSSTTLSTILLMIRLQLMCRSLYIHITCTHIHEKLSDITVHGQNTDLVLKNV